MAANKYTGEVPVKIGKQDCTLVFDWGAISDLHSQFEKDLKGGLLDVGKINCPKKIAAIVAIGLKKYHPEITADFILSQADNYMAVLAYKKYLDVAIAYSYFGADLMKEIETASEKLSKLKSEISKKKKK